MVELIDVLPAILELAGVEAPHRHFGRSLLPLTHDASARHREDAFTEAGFAPGESAELYHRATDAAERVNLVDSPEYAIALNRAAVRQCRL